jgi:uncharacterized protein (TIGR03000 family)
MTRYASLALLAAAALAGPSAAQYYRIPGNNTIGGSHYSQYPPGQPGYRFAYPGGSPYYGGPPYGKSVGPFYLDPIGPTYRSPYSYQPSPLPPPAQSRPAENQDRVTLTVTMPTDNAVLLVGGQATKQTGKVRTFVSPPLPPGLPYSYELTARWTDAGGKEQTAKRAVRVQAGAALEVSFEEKR